MSRQLFVVAIVMALAAPLGGQPVQPPAMTPLPKNPPFKYVKAKVPFYPAGKSWGTTTEPLGEMQLPLKVGEAIKRLSVPVDFEVKVFAADPDIKRPICMNWDERGRLWIAETVDYPNELKPAGQGRDRIVICEDTDGNGRANKFTVFADKLSIPTGFTFHKDGIIVVQAPHTLWLRDTDGDGVADKRAVLFSGWGTGDTHAGPSNLHYGFDNWIWGMCGYAGFNGTVGGEKHRFGQGFFRFKPDGSKLEFLRSTNNNSWGVGFSEEGLVFGSTANGNPSVYLPIPNRYYESVRGWSASVLGGIAGDAPMHPITERVRQVDHHGRFTAAAGHALYTARLYPKEYWNRAAFVAEPTGHLIATFQLERKGSDFVSRNAWNLLASDDEWCAPIMAEVGPDGCVWVIDWYNFIVQHNPTPAGFKTGKGQAYETELRDKKHGRVYRLVPKKLPSPPAPLPEGEGRRSDARGQRNEESGGAFLLPSPPGTPGGEGQGEGGQRPLQRRVDFASDTVPLTPTPLPRSTGGEGSVAQRSPHLVAGQGVENKKRFSLRKATPERLLAAVKNDNMLWRKHVQRLLVERGQRDVVPGLLNLIADPGVDELGINPGAIHALWTLHGLGVLDGKDADMVAVAKALEHRSAGVRSNAALVLPRNHEAAHAILDAKLLNDADAHVRLAALLALAKMPRHDKIGAALATMLRRAENLEDRWIPEAATSAAAAHDATFLAAILASKDPLPARMEKVVTIVAEHHGRVGDVGSTAGLIAGLAKAQPGVAETIVAGLAKGWPKNRPVPPSAALEANLKDAFTKLPAGGRGNLLRLTNAWGLKTFDKYLDEIRQSYLAVIGNDKLTDDNRVSAARELVGLGGDDAIDKLIEFVTPRTPPALASGLVEALSASPSERVAPLLLKQMPALTPSARAAAVRVLLGRPERTRALLDAVEKGAVALGELALDQKEALLAHPDGKLAARARKLLAKSGGLPNPDRQKVVEELLPLTQLTGNPALGKAVFTKQCANCHTHGGEGAKIGPDLTGMATHPKAELLIHIIDPSRSVEGNFRVYTIATADGKVLSGLLTSESKTAIEVIDSQAKKHVLLRENIEELTASNKSLMPDGFEKQVSKDELVNLLEFLTQRGKFLPLPLAKAATIVSTRGMFNNKDDRAERLIFADWSVKTFKGVPFHLVDPQGERVPNVVLLHGPHGQFPPKMPKSVKLTCNSPALAIHLLSGVAGWGFPIGKKGSHSLTVRLHLDDDGKAEDHKLLNGVHFADYIRRVDVPGSDFAFDLAGRQIRYLAVHPKSTAPIREIEFLKGGDQTAPLIMAVTVETR